MILDSKVPGGPLADKWDRHKFESKLVNPANSRKYTVIVVGTGLAGASAAASLGELGYNVKSFCIHDSPRRAHSIAAQGGINAAKNYQNDGDSVYRLFYDTIKGGDYRAREANVYRLAQLSVNIIDQCVAQGVPFAREYGGLLDNRSFGGAQVSRTFYARGQTGQQLLLGAYQSLMRQVEQGTVAMFPRREMLDLVVVDGQARGIICRNLITGEIERHAGPRGAALHRRLRHGLLPLDQRGELQRHRGVARAQARRVLRQPLLHADPSDLHSGVGHAPVEADADVARACATTAASGCRRSRATRARRSRSRKRSATTTWSGSTRASATSCRATSRRATPRRSATRGAASGESGLAVYLDFADAIKRLGARRITGAVRQPLRHVPQDHRRGSVQGPDADLPGHPLHDGRAVGGLQPDEQRAGPARPRRGELLRSRRQPPRRQRADAGAGRRLLRHPLHARRTTSAARRFPAVSTDHDAFKEAEEAVQQRIDAMLRIKGTDTPRHLHRELGQILWDYVGMSRNDGGLRTALAADPAAARALLAEPLGPGRPNNLNKNLEYAGRVADYLEFAELLALDALHRKESCGGHFREESQTPEGEALRDDANFSYVAAWEFKGVGVKPELHKEPLHFEYVKPTQRSYK